jgi:hypothetical protein
MLGIHKMLDNQQCQCIIIVKNGLRFKGYLMKDVITPNAIFLSLEPLSH